MPGEWIALGPAGEWSAGRMRAYDVPGAEPVAVAWLEGGALAAFDDTCTHEECSLSEGDIEGPWVVCYCHNAAFELETGAVARGPAEDPIRVHEARIVDGELQIRMKER
jgi:nitrite reductase/ring-hydroxylating ferredoxin subunit